MNPSLTALSEEHRAIERVIDSLVSLLRSAQPDTPDLRLRIGRYVDFFRELVDGYHHHKEERELFPALERCGMSRHAGPTGVMLHEHDLCRSCVLELAKISSGPLTRTELEDLRSVVRDYRDLLVRHIAKEDNVLYPMAERILPPAVAEELEQAIAKFDDGGGTALRSRLFAAAEQLAETPREAALKTA